MFTDFFFSLREAKIPVSLREYLTLIEALEKGVVDFSVDDFYFLSRATLVKDEKNLDRFDQVFGQCFKGLEAPTLETGFARIPAEWLKALTEKFLTEEEKAKIEALGGWEKLMETLRERLAEQKNRHQGGGKWIGTGGTSPFGAYGYNPEGIRIGQDKNRHHKAVKVWDKREFRNLDDSVELGTRNIKVALRKLRKFAREGAADQLDLPDTIHSTAKNGGFLDLRMVPQRHNAIKVLIFFDIGGSMDPHIRLCEELFSAARTEFKHLEFFYFHNCLYEGVWQDNTRRYQERVPTEQVMRTFPHDYKVIFVGDASMSPYELIYPGGSVEHWNEESGEVWMRRLLDVYPKAVWLNPVPMNRWGYTTSIEMVSDIMSDRMYPLTIEGLDAAMSELRR